MEPCSLVMERKMLPGIAARLRTVRVLEPVVAVEGADLRFGG